MRKSLALTLSAGLLLALSACSASSSAADCSSGISSGDASSLVSTTGDLGGTTTSTFPYPLVADSTEASVEIAGDGAPAGVGGIVNASYTLYDGSTGASGGAPSAGLIIASDSLPGGLGDVLACTPAGGRVSIVLPNDAATQIVPGAPGSLVMVIDVLDAYPAAAKGAAQIAPSGFPGVVHGDDGRPGVSIGTTPAPDEVKSAVLIKGDGATVAEGDSLILQSTAVSFDTKKVTSNTWAEGKPVIWLMSDDATATSGSTQPAGIVSELVGQTVGSEVIVLIPGDTDAGTAATAYVVDILGVVPAQ
ncbi:hypothetical protein [Herbiconiux sp. YIM B11900]|uniref:hypothetical protein n=1 Tax=Herbiconiux sp. YIM B11900 TaxID=3404131 RepID=UPI003F8417B3